MVCANFLFWIDASIREISDGGKPTAGEPWPFSLFLFLFVSASFP
jgi:hypothetical protein